MLGNEVHVCVRGSKLLASFVPKVDAVWPPGTKMRPSGMAACPAQNRSVTVFGTGVKLFVPGSHTCAWIPESSKANTFPVCMRIALTATIGQLKGAAHWPICAASVVLPPDGLNVAIRASHCPLGCVKVAATLPAVPCIWYSSQIQ